MAVELEPGVTVIVEAPRPTLTPVKAWLETVLVLPMTESAPSSVTGAAVNVSNSVPPLATESVWLIVTVLLPTAVMMAPVPMPVPVTPWPMARPTELERLSVLVVVVAAPSKMLPTEP